LANQRLVKQPDVPGLLRDQACGPASQVLIQLIVIEAASLVCELKIRRKPFISAAYAL
jgi:hypothetical protein